MPDADVPPGECRVCWPCSKKHQQEAGFLANFLGIGAAANKPCSCEGHVGGCPPNMIVPRQSIWR